MSQSLSPVFSGEQKWHNVQIAAQTLLIHILHQYQMLKQVASVHYLLVFFGWVHDSTKLHPVPKQHAKLVKLTGNIPPLPRCQQQPLQSISLHYCNLSCLFRSDN